MPSPRAKPEEQRTERAVQVLKAMAHPLRIRIVAALAEEPLHVNALAERLRAPQAIVSQQLRVLRMTALVTSEREHGLSVYRLREPKLTRLLACIDRCSAAR